MRKERTEWKPRTELGRQVLAGEVTGIDKIFQDGKKIREPEIVDKLLPALKSEIIFFGGSPGKGGGVKRTSTRRTARMHRSGRRFKISALVVVGTPGYLGIGRAVANEHSTAIDKAAEQARLNLIPIRRGCGSWECGCGQGHSIPMVIEGKSGSVRARLLPAPKGLGLAIGEEGKKLVRLAGIRDVWTKILGQTRTRYNYAFAIYDAFRNLNKMKIELPEAKTAEELAEIEKELALEKKIEEEKIKKELGEQEEISELGFDEEAAVAAEQQEAEAKAEAENKTKVPPSE